MPRKKTLLFKQYKKRFLQWLLPITGLKALLIFILAPIVSWVLLDGFITIRNSIELTNEMNSIKLPPSFKLEKTEQEYGSVCWDACPTITRTYTFSLSIEEASRIARESFETAGYQLEEQSLWGGKGPFSLWPDLRYHSIEINIDRHAP